MSSKILLLVILVHGVLGTFPPVSNPPPIPAQAFRTVDISTQQFYAPEDINQGPPQPNVKDGPYLLDPQQEQRWYIQETPTVESAENPVSIEGFDRYYRNGDLAVGPVATPLPDDAYVAQPSSISKANPSDSRNPESSDVWILRRGSDNQYFPERWIPVSTDRMVEVVNQESNSPVATDIVKSIAAPLSEIPVKRQYAAAETGSIVQQIFVRPPNVINSQKVLQNPVTVVEDIPSVKQVVDIQQPYNQIVQQQFTKDSYAFPPPPPPQLNAPPPPIISAKSFSVPPPPPPPIKGEFTSPKVISSIPVDVGPASNILISGKSGSMQQVRHIWIPTSSRTGRFISIPIDSVNSGKSVTNKGVQIDPASISVSDTWVLNQDGPVTSFEQPKSLIPPPVVQGGKVVFQDSSVIQLDGSQKAQIVSQIGYPQNPTVSGKSVNAPFDIWPVRNDLGSSKALSKSVTIDSQDLPIIPPKSLGPSIVSKYIPPPPPPPVLQQKNIINSKYPPQFPQPVVPIVNGKPCPIPLQKSPFPLGNPSLLSAPVARFVTTQNKQPLTRIIRINRYPSGSYYLLNNRFRSNTFAYPSSVIQQPKSKLVRLIQANQFPFAVQSKQPILPSVQTKQISIPVQTKAIPPTPTRLVAYSLPTQQIFAPVISQKSPNRFIYPVGQAIRYAYPWNPYLKSSLVPGKNVVIPRSSPFKLTSLRKSSALRSSESLSSEDSSSEEKVKKPKKEEKLKKDEKPKKEEETKKEEINESEVEKETEVKPTEIEKESEEIEAESKSEEIIEAAESFTAPRIQVISDGLEPTPYYSVDGANINDQFVDDNEGQRANEPGNLPSERTQNNFISNTVTDIKEKSSIETTSSTEDGLSEDIHTD